MDYASLPIEILAYTAGIVDGEGCISISAYKDARTSEKRFRGDMAVGMTNKDVIDWLGETLDGNVYKARASYDKTKAVYVWQMCAADAAKLLSAILPFLIVKKKQAELMIKFAATMTIRGEVGRKGLAKDVHSARSEMAKLSSILNRKGP